MNDSRPPLGAEISATTKTEQSETVWRRVGSAMGPLLAGLSRPLPVAIFVFAVGLAITLFASRAVEVRERRLIAERFGNIATQLLADVQRHQGVHEQSLRAGAALYSIAGSVNASQWRALYDNLRVAEMLPGVQGFGFAEAVAPGERAAHVARIRAQGSTNYTITPDGERGFYTPIAYLEPLDRRNQQALGFDMFSEPERRAAMTRAATTGMTAATGRVRLVQEIEAIVQPGFLLYSPVYRVGKTGVETGPFPALAGFVYSPVRVVDFFNAIIESFLPDVVRFAVIEVFDGPAAAPEALIFTSGDRQQAVGGFTIERPHDLFGREWTFRMSPLPAFLQAVDPRGRRDILVGGLALSLMAGLLAWLVAQRQLHREEAALRNDMVAREMSHRVKNLLAVIQSIASRTLAGGRTLPEARSVFADRLAALARAHTALVDGRWSGASLRDLLQGELSPFGARVSMAGPPVRLNSQMAQNMAMAVHELATNAMKYGALSEGAGVVRIRWSVRPAAAGEVFSFSWEEAGGPPASEPAREGFGQTLLKRLIGATIGSEPVAEYAAGGFKYRFECPLQRIAGSPADDPVGSKRAS